jgi:hypothetical protein
LFALATRRRSPEPGRVTQKNGEELFMIAERVPAGVALYCNELQEIFERAVSALSGHRR